MAKRAREMCGKSFAGPQSSAMWKLAARLGKDMAKLRDLILSLTEGQPLPRRYKDHPLTGEWTSYRDCHVEPDWLLLYKIDGDVLYMFGPAATPIRSDPASSRIDR